MIKSRIPPNPTMMIVDEADPRASARRERFDRNWGWFRQQAPDVYSTHRGKVICVAGQELFVADTTQEAVALASAAHPEDEGRFTLYIPQDKLGRNHAHSR